MVGSGMGVGGSAGAPPWPSSSAVCVAIGGCGVVGAIVAIGVTLGGIAAGCAVASAGGDGARRARWRGGGRRFGCR